MLFTDHPCHCNSPLSPQSTPCFLHSVLQCVFCDLLIDFKTLRMTSLLVQCVWSRLYGDSRVVRSWTFLKRCIFIFYFCQFFWNRSSTHNLVVWSAHINILQKTAVLYVKSLSKYNFIGFRNFVFCNCPVLMIYQLVCSPHINLSNQVYFTTTLCLVLKLLGLHNCIIGYSDSFPRIWWV